MKASELIEGLQALMGVRGNDPEVIPDKRLDLYGPDDGYPDWAIRISDKEAPKD